MNVKKILSTLICLSLTALAAKAQITQEWEWSFDGATVGQPTHTFVINEATPGPSGQIIVDVLNLDPDTPRQRHLVLLDSDAQTVWTSDNLFDEIGEESPIEILKLSKQSLIFSYVDTTFENPDPESLSLFYVVTYGILDISSTPVLSTIQRTNEDSVAYKRLPYSSDPIITTSFNNLPVFEGSSFVTWVLGTGDFESVYVALRKYSLPLDSSLEIAILGSSGVSENNIVLSWTGELGSNYKIQEAQDLTQESWRDTGVILTGLEGQMTWSAPLSTEQKFYRVLVE